MPLSGSIDNESNGFGAVSFAYPVNGVQNGSPDCIALVLNNTMVLHFLSNEGAFLAVDVIAVGMMSTDIGVQEPEAFEIDRRAALEAAVQVTASSLLGLTFHCALCHDHKFAPLTQNESCQVQ